VVVLTDNNLQQIRDIVHEETDDMRHDLTILKQDVSILKQGVTLLKHDVTYLKGEVTRTGVLMEDLGDQFRVVMEMLSTNLTVKKQVDEHEPRIVYLETDNKLTKQTLASHSQQLKPLI
jgi:hypothetical protein